MPRTVVIDNLRAAVSKADWYDPELNPKIETFCRHYGTTVLPTRPYAPRHKGKIERGIGYVRDNALKGRTFGSLAEENRFLQEWERQVADCRIHGTTRRQVRKVFEADERPALLPLPASYFPVFNEGRRRARRDGRVEVDKAYYSVPPEYLGRDVWVRWDSRVARVFNGRFEQVAMRVKTEPGRFGTDPARIASEKISAVERGAEALLKRARLLGRGTGQWAEEMLNSRGVQGVRVLVGLLSLARKHTSGEIETACGRALTHGAFRLRTIRELLKRKVQQGTLEFLDEHPLIRPMSEYSRIVRVSFRESEGC